MTHEAVITDHPELTEEDIRACLAYAGDRERRFRTTAGGCRGVGGHAFNEVARRFHRLVQLPETP